MKGMKVPTASGWAVIERQRDDILWGCDQCDMRVWCSNEPRPGAHLPGCMYYPKQLNHQGDF